MFEDIEQARLEIFSYLEQYGSFRVPRRSQFDRANISDVLQQRLEFQRVASENGAAPRRQLHCHLGTLGA